MRSTIAKVTISTVVLAFSIIPIVLGVRARPSRAYSAPATAPIRVIPPDVQINVYGDLHNNSVQLRANMNKLRDETNQLQEVIRVSCPPSPPSPNSPRSPRPRGNMRPLASTSLGTQPVGVQ